MTPRNTLVMAALASLLVGACGGPDQPGSLIAPTASSQSAPAISSSPLPAPTSQGATIDGVIAATAATPAAFRAGSSTVTVTVTGTNVSTFVGGDGHFLLTGVPPGDVLLQFSGGGIDCTVTIGGVQNGEQIVVALTLSGNGATIENQNRVATDNRAEVEGKIATLDTAGRTFEIAGVQVQVPLEATIRRGSVAQQLSDLMVGMRVHVNGVRNGPLVVAQEVQIQSDATVPKTETELTGWISAVAAGCSKPVFSLNGIQVTTANADFQRGDCSDIKVGQRVIVKGVKRDAATLDATRIRVEDLEIEVDGTISAVSGCPIPRLTVDGTVVTANGSTTFKAGTCADLVAGARTRARGARQADGSMAAYWIWPEVVRRESAEITGTISGLSGTCPALSFTVTPKSLTSVETAATTSRSVTTSAGTEFRDTTCGALKNGDVVYVKGTAQVKALTTDGPIAATLVQKSSASSQTTVELTGTIDSLSGTCPNLTFYLVPKGLLPAAGVSSVSTRQVVTSKSTAFVSATCSALKKGDLVYVKGTVQALAGCTDETNPPINATTVKKM
jgi:hypothetical protein